MSSSKRNLLLCHLFVLWISVPLLAGTLDDFESSFSSSPSLPLQTVSPSQTIPPSRTYSLGESVTASLFESILELLLPYGAAASMMRMGSPPPEFHLSRRLPGEPFIPLLKADFAFQRIDENVNAWNARLETGYGTFGLLGDFTRYREQHADHDLKILAGYVLFRMTFSKNLEIDLGIGNLKTEGRYSRSDLAFTLPVRISAQKAFGIEFRPAWTPSDGMGIRDYTLEFDVHRRFISFKAGYRWLKQGQESLNGPFAGFSLFY